MSEPIAIKLNTKPTIQNRATAMFDAMAQEIRHQWPMDRAANRIGCLIAIEGWALAIRRHLRPDELAFVNRKAMEVAFELGREKPAEDEAVNSEGQTIDRIHAEQD